MWTGEEDEDEDEEVWQWSAAGDDRSADCSRLVSSYLTGSETDDPNFPTDLMFTEQGGPGGTLVGKVKAEERLERQQVAGLSH